MKIWGICLPPDYTIWILKKGISRYSEICTYCTAYISIVLRIQLIFASPLFDRYAIRVCILINGLRIAQRIETVRPLNETASWNHKSSSYNAIIKSDTESEDNAVVCDVLPKNQELNNINTILAPLRQSHTNNVAKYTE